jgi:hypothetical protein
MVIFSATFAVPFWNWLRNWNRLRNFFRKAQAPHRITLSMWRRCLLNIYLFSYAPVTQACLEMLVCKQMSESCPEDSEDPACGHYLAIDFSIECDANEYKSTYRQHSGIALDRDRDSGRPPVPNQAHSRASVRGHEASAQRHERLVRRTRCGRYLNQSYSILPFIEPCSTCTFNPLIL